MGPLPELLCCIEDMGVTFPFIDYSKHSLDAKRAAVRDAFSGLALASKRTQVCGMLNGHVRPQQQTLHTLP